MICVFLIFVWPNIREKCFQVLLPIDIRMEKSIAIGLLHFVPVIDILMTYSCCILVAGNIHEEGPETGIVEHICWRMYLKYTSIDK